MPNNNNNSNKSNNNSGYQKPKMKKDAKEGMSGVVDSIYNMFEDQAAKGNLGTFPQQNMQMQKKKNKRYFED
jgi:hypothetical protein